MNKTTFLIMAFAGLGGLLYGFDLSVISGALVFMKEDIAISTTQASLIVAAVLGGGSLATLFSGSFADRFGRRFAIHVSAIVFIIGVVVLVYSSSFAQIMAGRLIQGIGVGIITIVVPLYLTETMPPRLRGRGVTLFQLVLTFGVLLGYIVNYAFKSSGDWQLMFEVALIPSILFLVGGFFLPRSPRWLYKRGYKDEARDVLAKVQSRADVDKALAEMKAIIEEEARHASKSWALLLRAGYRKAFLIALAVGMLNQLIGVNVLIQFNTTILKASGLHTAVLSSMVFGLANFLFTIVALPLVDKVGRRPLLIVGTAGVTVSLVFIGIMHALFPPSLLVGYSTLAGFLAFIIFYSAGPGVVVWLATSEILPLAIRAKGMAVALFANSLVSAGLAAIFMVIVGAVGYSSMFFILAFLALLYLLTAVFPLPETKGRSLEEIEKELFGSIKTKESVLK
jgi:sugar porter (SP) family MFS transporter